MRRRGLSCTPGERERKDHRDLQVLRQRTGAAYLLAREERDPGVLRAAGRHRDARRLSGDPAGRTRVAADETRVLRFCV